MQTFLLPWWKVIFLAVCVIMPLKSLFSVINRAINFHFFFSLFSEHTTENNNNRSVLWIYTVSLYFLLLIFYLKLYRNFFFLFCFFSIFPIKSIYPNILLYVYQFKWDIEETWNLNLYTKKNSIQQMLFLLITKLLMMVHSIWFLWKLIYISDT